MQLADITPSWLTNQLQHNGHLMTGRVIDLVSSHLASHASAALSLTVTYSDDAPETAPTRLICKLYSDEQFWDGAGEFLFYTKLAPEMQPFGNPHCYASNFDIDQQACLLLLEDVTITHTLTKGARLTQQQYQRCVDELVQLHAHWWEHPALNERLFTSPRGGPLRLVQALSAEQILASSKHFREQLAGQLEPIASSLDETHRSFCRLVGDKWFESFVERVKDGQQLTMIHGDYHHYGNIALPNEPAKRIRVLDWETWKRSIGVYDLAYLIAYQDESDKQLEHDLLSYYHQGLISNRVVYSWEQCLFDFRLSLLACIFPPLFWSNAKALKSAVAICKRWDCETLI